MNTDTASEREREMNEASAKQVLYIKSLSEQVVHTEEVSKALEISRDLWNRGSFSKTAASVLIDLLKSAPRVQAAYRCGVEIADSYNEGSGVYRECQRPKDHEGNHSVQPVARPEVPEGMHQLNGSIYKVQESPHTGRRYAKLLTSYAGGRQWGFEFAPGAMAKLSEETQMSLEQAKEFGALYGTCCVCGRTLTNEASIEAGIGPVCAKGF